MKDPSVSILVPNWNGRELLPELLAALEAQTTGDFETIVVDNGSADGSVEFLTGRPDVRLVALGRNTGFTGAVNRGLEVARGELVLLLNNDMAPRPDFLEQLTAAAMSEPAAGSFACRVLRRDMPHIIDSAGDRLEPSGRSRGIGHGAVDGPEYSVPRWVFGGTGGAVLYRRAVLDRVGGFDDDFFLYVEDTDVAFQAQLLGWRCRYVPQAIALHRGGASLRGAEDVRARYCLRNYLLFLLKDYPGPWLWNHRRAVLGQILAEFRFALVATRVRRGSWVALTRVGRVLIEVVMLAPRMLVRRWRMGRSVDLETLAEVLG